MLLGTAKLRHRSYIIYIFLHVGNKTMPLNLTKVVEIKVSQVRLSQYFTDYNDSVLPVMTSLSAWI